ncbi:MAG: DUF4278 domain-containing protein [Cyanobacteria bacterium P01_E01_bin.42]
MKLDYRGVNYKHDPLSLEVSESEIVGKYRGQEYRCRYPAHVPQLIPKPRLQYRGLAYQTCPLIQTETSLNAQLAAIARACGQLPPTEDEPIEKAVEIHQKNLRRNLDRRLEVAKAKGDLALVQLLEKECEQLAY